MRKVLFLTTVLAFVLASSVWAADVSGNWTLKMSGPQGEEIVPMVFKASGEKLTVTGTHLNFKEMTGEGTLKGDDIAFNLKSDQMEFKFTGKVTGDKMAGTREIGQMAQGADRGGAPSGAPSGSASGATSGAPEGAPPAGGQAPAGAPGGEPPAGGAPGGAPGGGQMSNDWTAERTK